MSKVLKIIYKYPKFEATSVRITHRSEGDVEKNEGS